MNRKEAEDFVYKSYLKAEPHLNYDDPDAKKRNPDLTKEMIQNLSQTPCVLVTGSKGKGSTAAMISEILQTEYRVGLMTSPHIARFNERFRVNGEEISDEALTEYINEIAPAIEVIDAGIKEDEYVSPIGIQAIVALNYFDDSDTDFNVFECGKGVRYDDVKNITHQYAVINTIFPEHTRELGNTLEAIAADKSHIISGNERYVYVAPQEAEVMDVLLKRAKERGVPAKIYGRDFYAQNIGFTDGGMTFDVVLEEKTIHDIRLPLLGEHQARNCALALAMCRDELKVFDEERIKEKLNNMRWPGRMETIRREPLTILDACINEESCQNVIKVLNKLKIDRVVSIVGIPDDKDYLGVLRCIAPYSKKVILTHSSNPHYRFSDLQKETAALSGIDVMSTLSLKEARMIAETYRRPILILGTTSLISDAVRLYEKEKDQLR